MCCSSRVSPMDKSALDEAQERKCLCFEQSSSRDGEARSKSKRPIPFSLSAWDATESLTRLSHVLHGQGRGTYVPLSRQTALVDPTPITTRIIMRHKYTNICNLISDEMQYYTIRLETPPHHWKRRNLRFFGRLLRPVDQGMSADGLE